MSQTGLFTTLYDKAYNKLMPRLELELPSYLTYHSAAHTKTVIRVAEELAISENVDEDDLMLIKTAALFHDAGFLKKYKEHEETSCEIAKELLPTLGYTHAQVDVICKCIMATRLPQKPHTRLEEILCDADLHYLGTDQYEEIADRLYSEFKSQGVVRGRNDWHSKEVRFLDAHRFFTSSARTLYESVKNKKLQELKDKQNQQPHFLYRTVPDILFIISGVIISGFALMGFLVPNHFFDGGVTGLSLLIHEVYHLNLGVIIAVLNLPFIIASYKSVSPAFAFKTAACVILLGIAMYLIPYPVITSDKLLIAIFGGAFLGLGVGLVMKAGSALDGIEVLALYTLKRTSFTITEIILGLNIIIFSIAAFKFGIETSLYSVLTYFTASRVIDYVVEGLQAHTGVTIISSKSEAIKYRLVNDLGRGITVYKGERGFLPGAFNVSSDVDIIFTVVSRLEMRKLKNLVHDTDPKAFIFANTIREATGGIIKRRHAH